MEVNAKELRELDDWCGKTFSLPFAVDEWILSRDGGESYWSSGYCSKREAEERLTKFQAEFPDSPYAKSEAVHWQLYGHASSDPKLAMEVLKQCCDRHPGRNISIRRRAGTTRWLVECVSASMLHKACIEAEADTPELTICLFAKKLFAQEDK